MPATRAGVILESTHMSTLEYIDLADLQAHAIIR